MFKYENVPDGATDFSDGREHFVGIAALLENSNEYREVISILGLNLLYLSSVVSKYLFLSSISRTITVNSCKNIRSTFARPSMRAHRHVWMVAAFYALFDGREYLGRPFSPLFLPSSGSGLDFEI